MNLSTPVAQRRSVLDFCLAPLRVRLGEESTGEVPAQLEIGGHTLHLDAWEQSALQESLSNGTGGAKPWASLVTEGIAFRVGSKQQINEFLKKSKTAESLISFVAAGLALSAESQRMIDMLIVAGQVGSAKKLAVFRNKIIQDVAALRRLLADDDYGRAEQESANLIGPPGGSLPVSSSVGRVPKGAGECKPRKISTADPFFESRAVPDDGDETEGQVACDLDSTFEKRRLQWMSLFLFATTLVWMVFFMPRLFEPRAQVLEKLQFQHLSAVSTVTARPPSLYVEVDPQGWDALAPEDQHKLLQEIGRIAVEAEYNGVQVKKNQGGAVVGRWLREQGARLVGSGT